MSLHGGIKYLVVVLAVVADIVEDRLVDAPLLARGMPATDLVWDDVVSGLVLGTMIFVVLHYFDRAKAQHRQQLRIIADMNHHVRNALQVIQCRVVVADGAAIRDIDEAVKRIDWALREVLPGHAAETVTDEKPWAQGFHAGGGPCPS
jgi:hypothetical protein